MSESGHSGGHFCVLPRVCQDLILLAETVLVSAPHVWGLTHVLVIFKVGRG